MDFRQADCESDRPAPQQRTPPLHEGHAPRLQHRQNRLRRPEPIHGGPGHAVHPQQDPGRYQLFRHY